jgi:SH3-like domain-containing protein
MCSERAFRLLTRLGYSTAWNCAENCLRSGLEHGTLVELDRVIDVAANDVLCIRSGPAADRPIVGSIPPNGRAVHMVGACRDKWCPIEYGGVRGWVNRGYLTSE